MCVCVCVCGGGGGVVMCGCFVDMCIYLYLLCFCMFSFMYIYYFFQVPAANKLHLNVTPCQELAITALPGNQFTLTPQKTSVAKQEYT